MITRYIFPPEALLALGTALHRELEVRFVESGELHVSDVEEALKLVMKELSAMHNIHAAELEVT